MALIANLSMQDQLFTRGPTIYNYLQLFTIYNYFLLNCDHPKRHAISVMAIFKGVIWFQTRGKMSFS